MGNTCWYILTVLVILFASTEIQSIFNRKMDLKLINKDGNNFLYISGDMLPPIKCYRTQEGTTEEIEYVLDPSTIDYHRTYIIKSNQQGNYWCEDSIQRRSNTVTIRVSRKLEVTTLQTQKPMPSVCPAQTTKDEYGNKLNWPSIKIDETYFINGTNCIKAVAKCIINFDTYEPQLIEESNWNSDWPMPCYIEQMNLKQATNQLRKLTRKSMVTRKDLTLATAIVNQALQANRTELSQSREDTTFVVQALDSILNRVVTSSGERVNITHQQVSVYVINADKELPRGIALTNVSKNLIGSTAFTFDKESELGPQEDEIDIAIFLPTVTNKNTSNLQIAFFNDDSAFIEEGQMINSRIISVSMDSVKSVDIMFKSWNSSGEKHCVFWDFNKTGGGWNNSGCELVSSPNRKHDMCRCTHLTHFAEIISPSGSMDSDVVLDIISLVGCSLSLIGLFGIFLTGAIFWQWRAQIGNKILIHLSASVALNMIIFLIVATGLLPNMCIPMGALLHYSILTSFCWMLVCAGLQFMRLVSVFRTQYIPHLLLKTSLFAWGIPLVPVSIVLAISVELYEDNGRGLCYPRGLAFYLAVICPILSIVVVNLIVFGTIIHHLYENSGIKRNVQSERKIALRRFLTCVLLFFLLGLSWMFGLLANLSKVFAYLFCITATLQGFVLFLFFVLGEKKSRRYWTHKSSTQKETSTTITPTEGVALRQREET